MIDDGVITGKILLQHMQGMKGDLQTQIGGLTKEMRAGFALMRQGFATMDRSFEDARLHREALQEDLYATMGVQAKHSRTLKRLSSSRSA